MLTRRGFLRWLTIGAVGAPFLVKVEPPHNEDRRDEVRERLAVLEYDVGRIEGTQDVIYSLLWHIQWDLSRVFSTLYGEDRENEQRELTPRSSEEVDA